MQKVMYFAPGVTALVLYGLPALSGGLGAMHGAVWFFIALLFVSALLLWRGKWWGCLGGVLAGMVLIDMSTRYTGQVIEIEGPLGILFCIYYGLCGLMIWKKESAQRSAQESQGEPYLKVDLIQLRLLLVFSVSSYCLFMQGFAFPSLSRFWEFVLRILAAFSLQLFFCRTKWPAVHGYKRICPLETLSLSDSLEPQKFHFFHVGFSFTCHSLLYHCNLVPYPSEMGESP